MTIRTTKSSNSHQQPSSVRILRSMMLALLVAAGLGAEAARFFRYVDADGRMVLSHTIPAERAKFGYEIVDEYSRVIQTVQPQLSDEEYKRQQQLQADVAQCQAALDRVRKLYQTVNDIDYAQEQDEQSVENSIANTRANLVHARTQKQDLESQAAQLDIAGETIPRSLLDNIERARQQEINLQEQIEVQLQEQSVRREQFDAHRVVFGLDSCDQGLPDSALAAVK